MNTFVEYTIGRQNADILIADAGVSRLHAELVTADGSFYLTDCGSTSGTYVYRQGGWQPIQQDFVAADEKLRFGRKIYTVPELLALLNEVSGAKVGDAKAGTSARTAKMLGAQAKAVPADALPDGKVKRDALTGEIIGLE